MTSVVGTFTDGEGWNYDGRQRWYQRRSNWRGEKLALLIEQYKPYAIVKGSKQDEGNTHYSSNSNNNNNNNLCK